MKAQRPSFTGSNLGSAINEIFGSDGRKCHVGGKLRRTTHLLPRASFEVGRHQQWHGVAHMMVSLAEESGVLSQADTPVERPLDDRGGQKLGACLLGFVLQSLEKCHAILALARCA